MGKKRKHSAYTDKESSLAHLRKLKNGITPKKNTLTKNSQDTFASVTESDLKLTTDVIMMSELDSDHIDKAQAILRKKFTIKYAGSSASNKLPNGIKYLPNKHVLKCALCAYLMTTACT